MTSKLSNSIICIMEDNKSKKEITIDDLALMVAEGFNEVNEKMDKSLKATRIELGAEITSAKEEIKAELNKKVDIFTHKDLEYQVEKLEEKNGITLNKNLATA